MNCAAQARTPTLMMNPLKLVVGLLLIGVLLQIMLVLLMLLFLTLLLLLVLLPMLLLALFTVLLDSVLFVPLLRRVRFVQTIVASVRPVVRILVTVVVNQLVLNSIVIKSSFELYTNSA